MRQAKDRAFLAAIAAGGIPARAAGYVRFSGHALLSILLKRAIGAELTVASRLRIVLTLIQDNHRRHSSNAEKVIFGEKHNERISRTVSERWKALGNRRRAFAQLTGHA
jgi:hypothetical protein